MTDLSDEQLAKWEKLLPRNMYDRSRMEDLIAAYRRLRAENERMAGDLRCVNEQYSRFAAAAGVRNEGVEFIVRGVERLRAENERLKSPPAINDE